MKSSIRTSLSILCFYILISLGDAIEVSLHYTFDNVNELELPNVFNVTLSSDELALIKLHLKKNSDFNLDIPVHNLRIDEYGAHVSEKAKTIARKDIGFYHDADTMATFLISKGTNHSVANNVFKLIGEFHHKTNKYLFNSEKKVEKEPGKVETTTSPLGHTYHLQKLSRHTHDTLRSRTSDVEEKVSLRMSHINTDEYHKKSYKSPFRSALSSRKKRSDLTDYYIDVAAVIDYTLYSRHLNDVGNNASAVHQDILEHYAFVFTGISLLYQTIKAPYKIHVRLAKIYVADTREALSFLESMVEGNSLNSNKALDAFQAYVAGPGYSIVGVFDHAMLFTAYDLYAVEGAFSTNSTVGLANTAMLCRTDGSSTSLIENRKLYSAIDTGAHELGHSLSANHDGYLNNCSDYDRYIMAAINYADTPSTADHPWQFSPCSINAFTSFLRKTVQTSRGYKCLAFALQVPTDIPDVSNRLLGQEIKPDDQCRMLHGNLSYHCRWMSGNNVSDICHAMFCRNPQTSDICYHEFALMGTSCGDRKICINGRCVSDPLAPPADESCMFGDEPGPKYNHASCSDYINGFIGYCYNDMYRATCCSSCKSAHRNIQDCEYGDFYTDCTKSNCDPPALQASKCCTTCGIGVPFNPTTTLRSTSLRTPQPTTTLRPGCYHGDPDRKPELCTHPSVCYTSPQDCCSYCLQIADETVMLTQAEDQN